MPFPKCPRCGSAIELEKTTYEGYSGPLTCATCLAESDIHIDHMGQLQSIRPRIDPALLAGIPSAPPECFRDYQAAVKCFGAGIPKAAAVMCRYALQRGLGERGIAPGTAEAMRQVAMRQKPPLLSEMTMLMLRDAVWIGGRAGHPQAEIEYDVGAEEARHALDLTKRILIELFPQERSGSMRPPPDPGLFVPRF